MSLINSLNISEFLDERIIKKSLQRLASICT